MGVGTPKSTILDVDFSSLVPGAAASSINGISIARSGVGATVQTGVSTVASGIAINTPRIFSDGTHKGLLVEEARTNLLQSPRSPQTVPPWIAEPGFTANNFDGPDGSHVAPRLQVNSTFAQTQGPIAASSATTYAWSIWMRKTSGTGNVVANINDNLTINASLYAINVDTTWQLYKQTFLCGNTQLNCFLADGRNVSPLGLQALDQGSDMMMVELGNFNTSFFDGARGADLASIAAASLVNPSGKLALNVEFYPLAASSAYTADQYLFYKDANNNAYIKQSTRKIVVVLNGVSVTLPVVIPSYSAFDAVKIFLECGTGVATHAWVSINGTITDLGGGIGQAAVPTSGTIYLLNNSSAGGLSSVVSKIVSYL